MGQALMEDKNGSPNNLEWGQIVAEVGIMMNAGSVTTAIAMANVMLQLLKNPNVMKKLTAEIDSVLDDDEVVASHDKVKHLPYLKACLDESLRLFPPTSHGLTRAVPQDGMNILGEYIPGGTSVSISAYVAHRDETIFPMADRFIPERWLGEEGKALQPYFWHSQQAREDVLAGISRTWNRVCCIGIILRCRVQTGISRD